MFGGVEKKENWKHEILLIKGRRDKEEEKNKE